MQKIMTYVMALLVLSIPASAQGTAPSPEAGAPALRAIGQQATPLDRLTALSTAKGLDPGLPAKGGPTCTVAGINCNTTVNSSLRTTDCALADGTFVDFWTFNGTNGDAVTIDLTSTSFDTFLSLLDPTPDVVISDDDGGAGTNSRIVFTLDATGLWAIAVNNFAPVVGNPGNYALTLTCPAGPAAPSNLTATTVSSTEIDISWQDNSNNEDDFQVQMRTGGGSFDTIGTVAADSEGASISNLQASTTYTFRVRARNSQGNSGYSNQASATTDSGGPPPPPPPTGACFTDATTMCLNNDRFRVEVDWRNFTGNTGPGSVVPVGSDDSGLFYFFNADNWEMLVKVLDGCAITDHFWVFAAATTNVEYTLRVTDTQTGVSRQYFNPLGMAAPAITDTEALATCP